MRIIGLCKTFSGHEFITAAIEQLYDFLDAIVFINSEISWNGEIGNTVKPVIKAWQEKHDHKNKIIHHDCNVKTQEQQYGIGYDYIRSNLDPDWIMLFDSDEVWDNANLNIAKQLLEDSVEYNGIKAHMHTYLKSPFYRVVPPEFCKPTVFIRAIHKDLIGIRGNGVFPCVTPNNLFFHHFTYVRDSEKDVFKKIQTSLSGDREDVPQTELVDIEEWKKKKWDKITRVKNLHTTLHFEKSWYRVSRIHISELPIACRNLPIVQKWKGK